MFFLSSFIATGSGSGSIRANSIETHWDHIFDLSSKLPCLQLLTPLTQCCGWQFGSGLGLYQWLTDPNSCIRLLILLFSSVADRHPTKNKFLSERPKKIWIRRIRIHNNALTYQRFKWKYKLQAKKKKKSDKILSFVWKLRLFFYVKKNIDSFS
jgi:hypothetical protein